MRANHVEDTRRIYKNLLQAGRPVSEIIGAMQTYALGSPSTPEVDVSSCDESPQQRATRPELARSTPELTSWAVGSDTQRESSDSTTNIADESEPRGPKDHAQFSHPSSGRRFAALRSPIAQLAIVVIVATAGGFLLMHPAAEKLAVMTTPALNTSSTPSEEPSSSITTTSAISPEQAPELAATSPMPAPAAPREEGQPIIAAAARAFAPDAAAIVSVPGPAAAPEEAAPVALAPDTTPTVAPPDPAPLTEAAPIVAPTPVAPAPDTAPTVAMIGPATPPAEPRASTLKISAGEISSLLTRGDSLFGVRDVTSARLYYERAADAGDAQAALRLGETYDPSFLAWARLNEVRGDPVVATRWYRRARELGNPEAEILLKSLHAN